MARGEAEAAARAAAAAEAAARLSADQLVKLREAAEARLAELVRQVSLLGVQGFGV